MKFLGHCLSFLPIFLLIGCGPSDQTELTIYAAASLTDVLKEAGDDFSRQEDIEIVFNFASSGALAQQLTSTPRADIFISADQTWMDEIAKRDEILTDSRLNLLSNQLVVISHPKSDIPALSDLSELAVQKFTHLAIGDPQFVPAGKYAKEYLSKVLVPNGTSLWNALGSRASPAPVVRAVLAQVASKREVVGITYKSDLTARPNDIRLLFEIPAIDKLPIQYPIAILRSSSQTELARKFIAYLQTPQNDDRFLRAGFIPIQN
ncbi:MAG: molybdate ABC transporter substrate-binding protein [Verrucomicrobiota bacterium]